MEALDFFQKMLGIVESEENEPVEPIEENEPVESIEETTGGNEPSGVNEPDIRELVRNELKSMMQEIYEKEKQTQKTARAASVQTVPTPEPERSVEDIMAERYSAVVGIKKKEKE